MEVYLDGYTLDPVAQVNRSNPNAPVKFPGFGFWPLWYWETFRNLTVSRNVTQMEPSPGERNEAMCEIVKELFAAGLQPVSHDLLASDTDKPYTELCQPFWDGVSCFPATMAGLTRVIPCMSEFDGVRYTGTRKLNLSCRTSNHEYICSCTERSTILVIYGGFKRPHSHCEHSCMPKLIKLVNFVVL